MRHARAEAIELAVSSHPCQMCVVRAVTNQVADMAGFAERDRSLISLAVDEACTNIIKYSYRQDYSRPIRLRYFAGPAGIEIVVRDFGRKPKPEGLRPKRAGTTRCGGLGIHFVLSVMDTVVYDTSRREGTVLTMTKALPPAAAPRELPSVAPKPRSVTVIVRRGQNGKPATRVL